MTRLPFSIRPARAQELEWVTELYGRAADWLCGMGLKQWERGKYPAQGDVEEAYQAGTLWTGWSGEALAAAMVLNEWQAPGYALIKWQIPMTRPMVVHMLAVDPELGGQGFGGRMVEFAREFAKSRGMDGLRLDAAAYNPVANRLYQKMGFTRAGSLISPYNPPGWDEFTCYELKI